MLTYISGKVQMQTYIFLKSLVVSERMGPIQYMNLLCIYHLSDTVLNP